MPLLTSTFRLTLFQPSSDGSQFYGSMSGRGEGLQSGVFILERLAVCQRGAKVSLANPLPGPLSPLSWAVCFSAGVLRNSVSAGGVLRSSIHPVKCITEQYVSCDVHCCIESLHGEWRLQNSIIEVCALRNSATVGTYGSVTLQVAHYGTVSVAFAMWNTVSAICKSSGGRGTFPLQVDHGRSLE